MQRTPLGDMACSVARSLDIVGEWWTPLIVRDVYVGLRRFDEIQANLGISRKVLTQRLDTLLDRGVLERRPYQDRPIRHEYVLTEKGHELVVVLMALMAWGDRWESDAPPMLLRHTDCGHQTIPTVACSECGEALGAEDVDLERGPGARLGPGTTGYVKIFGEP
jgi:DNA-binding HxlR family transcriptional regulator